MKNNAVTDQEKREKKIVVKKLAEMEEELKLLALSENLTDQVDILCRKFSISVSWRAVRNKLFDSTSVHLDDGPTEIR